MISSHSMLLLMIFSVAYIPASIGGNHLTCSIGSLRYSTSIFSTENNESIEINKTFTRRWLKNPFTIDSFIVSGVDLAKFALFDQADSYVERIEPTDALPFELFDDFNIIDNITGNEEWWDIVRLRRHLERPTMTFYMDKIAQKRWLPTIGVNRTPTFLDAYAWELTELEVDDTTSKSMRALSQAFALERLIPRNANYVAKPSHMSNSNGVFLWKFDSKNGISSGQNGRKLIPVTHLEAESQRLSMIQSLVAGLYTGPDEEESWALKQSSPGVLIEKRFTSWEDDNVAALEFKVFVIWGRVHYAYWKRGVYHYGAILRDGTVTDLQLKKPLPDWVNWNKIVEIAETLGANKDMFRVDIFAGVPADSSAMRPDATREERMAAVEYVVSECEIHPTTSFRDMRIMEESARLWIAGYKIGNYKLVPNTEMPQSFLKTKSFTVSKQ